MRPDKKIYALGLVAREIYTRVPESKQGTSSNFYCIIRRRADNDMFILGPFSNFHAAAEAAIEAGDTVKPMFREEDLHEG